MFEYSRAMVATIGVVVALLLIAVFHLVLPDGAAALLIDRGGHAYPLSVQNIMWVVFFVGCGELWIRYQASHAETEQLYQQYLPESVDVVLQPEDMGAIYQRIRGVPLADQCFLPRLIQKIVLQFQSTQSVEQSSTILTSHLELYLHEVDLRYNMLRYIMWVIPSLGFIGTVIGISLALNHAGQGGAIDDPNLLPDVTKKLAVAFDTTMLALIMAAGLVFGANVVQGREERALNMAGQYCMDNLINKIYVPKQQRY